MKAVNLLPPEQRGAVKKAPSGVTPVGPAVPAAGGAGPFIVIGALAVAVVALAAYVLVGNSIKDHKAELARAQADQAAIAAKVAQLKPYADFQALATSRVATVQALARSRFDWEQSLRDLSNAIPSNVYVTNMTGTLGANAGGNPLRGAINAPAISIQGCTKTQSDVARMMSSLRAVRGVTRVSLASSNKESAGGTATPSITGGTAAQTCPKGSPPSFDVVAFFERSAAVATGAPAPSGATGPTGVAPTTGAPPAAGAAAPATGAPAQPGAAATTAPGGTTP